MVHRRRNSKNQCFRKKAVRNTPICWRCIGLLKSEDILPIQLLENNRKMFLSDLQTVAFGALKNATKIADIELS